jgi:hypothetical protein
LKAQVIFYANPPLGIPADLSFYFPCYPFLPGAPGSLTAHTAGMICTLDISHTLNGQHLTAAASIDDGHLTWAILQGTTAIEALTNPIKQEWDRFSGTVPAGQRGRIKCWE